MYYPRGSGASGTHRGDNHRMYEGSEDLYPSRAPSPPPPSVPPRPASYTPRLVNISIRQTQETHVVADFYESTQLVG